MERYRFNRRELGVYEEILEKYFHQAAKVTNFEKGYVSIEFINQMIDTRLSRLAAKILAYKMFLQNPNINKIVGIPTMGNYLAVQVAEELNLPLAPSRKGDSAPGAWKQTVQIDGIGSFTTGNGATHIYNGLAPGDVAGVVDDFLATGETTLKIVNAFENHGVRSVIGTYCAKLFQPGYSLLRNRGIEPLYVFGIKQLHPSGKLILARSAL